MESLLENAWVLPAIMAGSFLVILLIGKRLPEKGRALIGIAAVGVCFVLSIGIGLGWIDRVDDPPEGDEAIAAAEACGLTAEQAVAAVEGGHGEQEAEGTDGDHAGGEGTESEAPGAEEGARSEQAAGASGLVAVAEDGEAGAAAEEEHHSVVPVCRQWTWFETGSFPGVALLGKDGGEDAGDHGGAGTGESAAAVDAEGEEPTVGVAGAEEHGGLTVQWGTLVDGLSAMMLFVVTAISLLVHIYSIEYLHNDVRHTHYYAFLSLFTASMLFYVLGTSTIQMLVGWELVGLCSFALIGHWWEEKKNSDAALKAFLTNRVGDMGLIVGIALVFFAAGQTFSVLQINDYAQPGSGANQTLLLIGALCLFGGVTSKSGQFPLHTWLPDAMAGPTPVSALIHAATMVCAGVYLIARLYPVFFEGLNIGTGQINYVAFIGGFTVVMAACLAFVQTDLKKVLAYSTVSQLGYMVMALGVGAWTAGIFHLFTHAFFKAGLFLGAGSVSHACHHTFDMREMGGLRKHMPVTFWTWIVGTLALMGIFPLAGFWSKDEVLAGAQQGQEKAYLAMLVMGVIGAMLTAAYMTRATWLTFFGEYRGHAHPHESPKIITVPLVLLSIGAALFGLLNTPKWFSDNAGVPDGLAVRFEHYVEPTFLFVPGIEHPEFSVPLALISTGLALLGFFLAYQYFALGRSPFRNLTQKAAPARAGYRFLENKYYLDALYEQGVRDSVKGPIARAAYWTNQNIIDKIVNGVGVGSRLFGTWLYRNVDQKVVDGAVNGTGTGASESGQVLRRIQTGNVQWYAALLFMGVVLFGVVSILVVTV